MKEKAITINNLSKKFKNNVIIDQLSLEVYQGEIFCLMGPNGSGKTTLMKILTSLIKADKGEVFFSDYSIYKDLKKIKKIIGVVPQEISLYSQLNAYDNLWFWGKLYGLSKKELASRIEEVVNILKIDEFGDKKVGVYSGGMSRRLNLGVALLHKPKIILLDEPTVGIDIQTRFYIIDILKKLRDEGVTIFYTSHYINEIEKLSDRIAIIDKGKILKVGTMTELLKEYDNISNIEVVFNGINEINITEYFKNIPEIIKSIQIDDVTFNISTRETDKILSSIVKEEEKGIIKSIKISKYNLEDLFLELTGKGLRG